MTRKRIGEGLLESLRRPCPHCEGRGIVFDQELIGDQRTDLAGLARRGPARYDCPSARAGPVTERSKAERMYAVIKTGGKQYRVDRGPAARGRAARRRPTARSSSTPVLLVDGDTVVAAPDALAKAIGHGQGRRRGQGPEDHRLHLQEQDQPAQALGPPPALRHHRDHRHHEGLSRHVEDQGRRFHPERPRLQRTAPRREGLRRHRRARPAPSSSASAAPASTPARTSAAAATTPCSPPPTAR